VTFKGAASLICSAVPASGGTSGSGVADEVPFFTLSITEFEEIFSQLIVFKYVSRLLLGRVLGFCLSTDWLAAENLLSLHSDLEFQWVSACSCLHPGLPQFSTSSVPWSVTVRIHEKQWNLPAINSCVNCCPSVTLAQWWSAVSHVWQSSPWKSRAV